MKDYQGALKDFTFVIQKDPNPGMAYYHRGLLRVQLNDKTNACLDFKKSEELKYEKAAAARLQSCE
jgi:tetratricopeptide (TPR) repeat protein